MGPAASAGAAGASSSSITLVPRLERISWSLYWKEAMEISTECLEPVELSVEEAAAAAGGGGDGSGGLGTLTGQALLEAAAKRMGWPAEKDLHRLEKFTEPWERLIFRGRELKNDQTLQAAGVQPGDRVVVVRKALSADGWKVALADDFLSDTDDEN